MLRFEHIDYLYLLLAIPIFIALFVAVLLQRKRQWKKWGDLALVKKLAPQQSVSKMRFKFILYITIYSFLVIGLANPQIGSKMQKMDRKGIDLMIALDVSNSMLAQDIKPNRLARAKRAISKLIDQLEGDRLGIVVFAGKAYTQLPITSDYSAAKLFVNTINTKIVPTQGTSIEEAIDLSLTAFQENTHEKAIIIITDGENHEDSPIAATQRAIKSGVKVYTIGVGLPEGAPIPLYSGSQQVGFKKDLDGKTVVTKLDETTLQEIASVGEGVYVRANNTTAGLQEVFKRINQMEKQKYESRVFSDYEDRFQIFLSIAFLIIILELFISDKKRKWQRYFNLFDNSQSTEP